MNVALQQIEELRNKYGDAFISCSILMSIININSLYVFKHETMEMHLFHA